MRRSPWRSLTGGGWRGSVRRYSSGKRRGKVEATEVLRVGKIKWALPSRRCSQRIRVKGDRGGARGGGAGLCVEAERAGGTGRSGRNDHSTVARS
jgi:hypothetical protein